MIEEEQNVEVLKEFTTLMKSDAMFLILSQLTGIKLHHMYQDDDNKNKEKKNMDEDELYAPDELGNYFFSTL